MRWLEAKSPEDKRIAQWVRSVGVREDGVVFIPAAFGGNEHEVFLCLAYDATEHVTYLDHYYVPLDWLAKEFPKSKDLCQSILLTVQATLREIA